MGFWVCCIGFKGMEWGMSNGSDIEINLFDGIYILKNFKFVFVE